MLLSAEGGLPTILLALRAAACRPSSRAQKRVFSHELSCLNHSGRSLDSIEEDTELLKHLQSSRPSDTPEGEWAATTEAGRMLASEVVGGSSCRDREVSPHDYVAGSASDVDIGGCHHSHFVSGSSPTDAVEASLGPVQRSADKYVTALTELASAREEVGECSPSKVAWPPGSRKDSSAMAIPKLDAAGCLLVSTHSSPAARSPPRHSPPTGKPCATRSSGGEFGQGRRMVSREVAFKAAMLTSSSSVGSLSTAGCRRLSRHSSGLSTGDAHSLARSPSFGSTAPRKTAVVSHDHRFHWP